MRPVELITGIGGHLFVVPLTRIHDAREFIWVGAVDADSGDDAVAKIAAFLSDEQRALVTMFGTREVKQRCLNGPASFARFGLSVGAPELIDSESRLLLARHRRSKSSVFSLRTLGRPIPVAERWGG